MTKIRELLRDADPLKHEPAWSSDQRDLCRQAVLAAAPDDVAPSRLDSRSRFAFVATVILAVGVASLLGVRVWSPFVSEVQAAVRFEVRLAEDRSAPGLREAKSSGSDRSVYLHDEVVVTNSDIATAQVIPGDGPSHYWVTIKFTAAGAEKMRAATANHIGKPLAILLDGQVAAAPTLRTPITTSAVLSGTYTKTEAERIAKGIRAQ